MKTFLWSIFLAIIVSLISCGNNKSEQNQILEKKDFVQISPDFNADSAYQFVNKQVSFGTRVPNSEGHKLCGDYLVNELKRFGANVLEQKADLKAYNGDILNARNIIGSFNPDKKERLLLFAHWDTRPYADNDPNEKNQRTAIDGANDAASGVGVLLEIARNLALKSTDLGVDLIFFDAEDYGAPSFERHFTDTSNTWCLGSQYWSKNPHIKDYNARFGILLDMVGAPNATFYKEYFSKKYAGGVLEKVWFTAQNLGYGNYFVNKQGGAVTDDHVPVNEIRNIPSIDIIQFDPDTDSGFGWYWHTINDNMNNISKETLKAVGQTVMEVVYREK